MLDITKEREELLFDGKRSEKEVRDLISNILKTAYKSRYGTDDNAEVKFYKSPSGKYKVELYSRKVVVNEENYFSEVREIPLDEAREITGSDEVEVGDELEIPEDTKSFGRNSVQSAKQREQQITRDKYDDSFYARAHRFENTIVKGKIEQKNGKDFLVDIGLNDSDHHGNFALFPVRGQSPREQYSVGDVLRFYVEKVDKATEVGGRKKNRDESNVKILLSRSCKEFVKLLFEEKIREEISSGAVVIKAIARQAGVKTKIAVDTKKTETDPVSLSVGRSGQNVMNIMKEIEGEKIDVIRYNSDPIVFIANALVPAQVERVVEIDADSKYAVVIVSEQQQGIAIGQGGVNVKLAKVLCDWMIDVKTKAEFDEMDQTQLIHENVGALFNNEKSENEKLGIGEDETPVSDVGLDEELVEKLHFVDIYSIEEFFEKSDEELKEKGFTDDEISQVRNSVEIVTEEDDEDFECPVCHSKVPAGSTTCPSCGAEFEFE